MFQATAGERFFSKLLALKQNRSVKSAQLGVVDQEQKKRIAHAGYFPNIKNESTIIHVTDLQQLVIPGGSLGSLPATGPIPPQTAVIGQGNVHGLHQRHRTESAFDADVQGP